jgi:hypothetical protein
MVARAVFRWSGGHGFLRRRRLAVDGDRLGVGGTEPLQGGACDPARGYLVQVAKVVGRPGSGDDISFEGIDDIGGHVAFQDVADAQFVEPRFQDFRDFADVTPQPVGDGRVPL